MIKKYLPVLLLVFVLAACGAPEEEPQVIKETVIVEKIVRETAVAVEEAAPVEVTKDWGVLYAQAHQDLFVYELVGLNADGFPVFVRTGNSEANLARAAAIHAAAVEAETAAVEAAAEAEVEAVEAAEAEAEAEIYKDNGNDEAAAYVDAVEASDIADANATTAAAIAVEAATAKAKAEIAYTEAVDAAAIPDYAVGDIVVVFNTWNGVSYPKFDFNDNANAQGSIWDSETETASKEFPGRWLGDGASHWYEIAGEYGANLFIRAQDVFFPSCELAVDEDGNEYFVNFTYLSIPASCQQ